MILGVDLRVLASGRRTGVEQYTIGLLRALAGDNQHQYRFFYNAWKKAPLRFSWLRGQNRRLFEFDYPNKILDLGSLF
ncbi:MAG: hypothetical protein COU85_00190, partial [Candidatus Portnoybacteria bacterium CG10_big_fil_rev_8_21_14_0_10_44_7]